MACVVVVPQVWIDVDVDLIGSCSHDQKRRVVMIPVDCVLGKDMCLSQS